MFHAVMHKNRFVHLVKTALVSDQYSVSTPTQVWVSESLLERKKLVLEHYLLNYTCLPISHLCRLNH